MKSKRSRRAGRRQNKGKISQAAFDIITRSVIAILCLYIVIHCTSIIIDDKGKKEIIAFCECTLKSGMGLVVKSSNCVVEFVKNDRDKKELNNKKINSQMEKALVEVEKTQIDVKAVNELAENVKKENERSRESTSSKECETTSGVEEKKLEEAVAVKAIVPKPKLSGTKYTIKNLKSFKNTIKKFYTVASATTIKSEDLNIKKALDMRFVIEGDNSKPQILIYHTHSQEEFKDTGNSSKKSIVQVGSYLAKILREQFGYNVLHDTSTYDLIDGKLDRNRAYEQSRKGVTGILKDNPSINLILDLHRDGVGENVHLVTKVNGKDTATVMFFNGVSRLKDIGDIDYLYNPYLKENLALSLQMKLNAEAYYPGFTRKNYINAYQYNLDLCPKSMLIEMGAQTNTFQEVKNAAEPLAMLIHMTMEKK